MAPLLQPCRSSVLSNLMGLHSRLVLVSSCLLLLNRCRMCLLHQLIPFPLTHRLIKPRDGREIVVKSMGCIRQIQIITTIRILQRTPHERHLMGGSRIIRIIISLI
uniref:Uncharacterized protein n=1 Tax=Opuntia streptacantha TaxID=393608 RepID=A0A7C9APG5_OPUST